MSDVKPEVVEPDPVAPAIPNDEPVTNAGGDPAATTSEPEAKVEVEDNEA